MKNKIKIFTILFISLLLFSSGCEQKQDEQINPNPDLSNEVGYPTFQDTENDINQGYPLAEPNKTMSPSSTVNPSLGNVRGQILHKGTPVVGYSVFLADIITNDEGRDRVAALKPSSSPQAILDENGNFFFYQVQPDRYALMFSDGVSSYVLLVPQQDVTKAIILEVEKGKTNDLGILDYIDFPIDSSSTP